MVGLTEEPYRRGYYINTGSATDMFILQAIYFEDQSNCLHDIRL
jgi:hypothetical protein